MLSRDTGYTRPYGTNPYPGYDNIHSRPFLFSGQVNGRYTAMTRLVSVSYGGEAVAVLLNALRRRRVIALTLGGAASVTGRPAAAGLCSAMPVPGHSPART